MTNETKIITGVIIASVGLLIGAIFFLGGSSAPQTALDTPVDQQLLIRENSNKIGSSSAQVTLVEFGDYQCPACAAVHPLLKQLLSEYSGRILFIFRNFPLSIHPNAQIAAEAAEAAGLQGKYFEMHDKLYENQTEWANSATPLDIFTKYAEELKLDTEKFKTDVKDYKFSEKIQSDVVDGNKLNVNGTPTFYLNNKKLDSVGNYQDFKKKIDEALKN